jgi:hypothetical protein
MKFPRLLLLTHLSDNSERKHFTVWLKTGRVAADGRRSGKSFAANFANQHEWRKESEAETTRNPPARRKTKPAIAAGS